MREKLEDLVSIENIEYNKRPRASATHRAVVSFSKAIGQLYFNEKMVNLLDIEDWTDVVCGYDKRNNIIVLKKSDVEEYASVSVIRISDKKNRHETIENTKKRRININAMVVNLNVPMVKYYRAECNGRMIFLKPIEDEN